MSDFFNSKVENLIVRDVKGINQKRVKMSFDRLKGKTWTVKSLVRGKECKLIFENFDVKHSLLIHFYKAGCWEWHTDESVFDDAIFMENYRFSVHFDEGKFMVLTDMFHQSDWRWIEKNEPTKWKEWGHYRSPDIVLEHNDYRRHIHKYRNYYQFKKPILEIMNHPWFFNGISNISRCEILNRMRFSPFTPFSEVLGSEIMREEFFEASKDVLEELYSLGGTQFGIWKNPFGVSGDKFVRWTKIYRKGMFVRINGQAFYFDKKRWKNEWRYYKMKRDELDDGQIATTDI